MRRVDEPEEPKATDDAAPVKKRPGRKPGSKNKPKVEASGSGEGRSRSC